MTVDIVVKVGGSLLAHPACFDGVLAAVSDASATRRLLIVPGGGPFADTVREVDRQITLPDTAAHWMAVLAMDQYAYVLMSRLRHARVVVDLDEIRRALESAQLPVLAPSRWLRMVDALPHSWDVTSDSIAAWVTGLVGASRLVLIKPPGVTDRAVDPYFPHAFPAHVAAAEVIPADQIGALRRALTV